jgi:alpha-glucosidase (family GH31 glycosyl hydrolase)
MPATPPGAMKNPSIIRQTGPIVGGTGKLQYRFTILTDGLIRYEWSPDGQFEDRPSAFAAKMGQPSKSVPKYRVKETDSTVEIFTDRFHLTYDKQEFSPYGLFVIVYGYTGSYWRYGEASETLGGTARTLDGVDGRIDVGPGVVSQKGFSNIDDSSSMLFETDGFVGSRHPGRVDGYLFAYGHDYRAAVKALYHISGSTPLLPRWSLGNWWSRYYEYTAESYLDLMENFQKHEIPLSVAVLDMDWHLEGWTGYTWNKKLFPDPPGFLAKLHQKKLKTTLNDHPADGIHSHEALYLEVAKATGHDTSDNDPIPFDITNRRYLKAYLDIVIRSLENDGMDFVWVDWQQGPYSRTKGIDPLWMLNHYHFLHNAKTSSSHPIVFSRYAGPGSHRYPIGFSGDTIVTWKSLDFQPEFTATASNIGYGWWSHDIGGHMFGVKDDELLTRWIQLGVLSPIMRLHSSKSQWVAKEPWKLSLPYSTIITDFMRLRHRLIPYLHTMNARAAMEGEPLVQPMYWEYPARGEAYNAKNQYLFGSEMMVIPITKPQNDRLRLGNVKAWLPPGRFVDFFSGVVYDGDRELWLSRPLDQYPLFMKEGSIVPLDSSKKLENGGDNPDCIELVVVVGADGKFEIMEEFSVPRVFWTKTPIVFRQETGTLTIGPCDGPNELDRHRSWSVRFLRLRGSKIQRVTIDESDQKVDGSTIEGGSVVRVGVMSGSSVAKVILQPNPQLDVIEPLPLVEALLRGAQIEYLLKDAIWDILSDKSASVAVKIAELEALDMEFDLRVAILEYLVADSRADA